MARHPGLFDRHTTPALEAALADTPVVLVVGPRQAGKTTLCRLVADRRGARLLSLDDGTRAWLAGQPDLLAELAARHPRHFLSPRLPCG